MKTLKKEIEELLAFPANSYEELAAIKKALIKIAQRIDNIENHII